MTRWTNDIREAAYRTLAAMSFEDFHDLLKPGLHALSTTREALAAYCDSIGYDHPRFWFGRVRTDKWTARRERDAEKWLTEQAKGRKHKAKAEYFAAAAKLFNGLPRKAFNRIWNRVVPVEWKGPGPVIRSNR